MKLEDSDLPQSEKISLRAQAIANHRQWVLEEAERVLKTKPGKMAAVLDKTGFLDDD